MPYPLHEPWNTREGILCGRLCFLNETADLGQPIDWNAGEQSLLWRFNLHYFHYLHLLEPSERIALCRSWTKANPPGTGVSWHPYPTSLRVVNWCRAGLEDADLLTSLYRQAAFLYRNLETYICGNHLLENARALVVAGCFFEGQGEAPRWLKKGLDIYRSETREQILPDGCHYERSPMYHALMLEGYLDGLNVLPPDHPDRKWILQTVRRMGDALMTFVRPDGRLALFNDATDEIALPPEHLIQYLNQVTPFKPRAPWALPDAGYYAFGRDDIHLVIDGGPAGPDHLMAHAHADVFSYELSVAGKPFVVDSGVFEYPAGAMRDYVRSTAAHNTVSVDGVDQIECWDSFRVARRDAPCDVTFTVGANGMHFGGAYEGYAKLIGDELIHRRSVEVDAGTRTVTVEDRVDGQGSHEVLSRIHLHPDVTVMEEKDRFILIDGDSRCKLKVIRGELRWEEGWYCPRFGERIPNRVAVVCGGTSLPSVLTYRIDY